MAARSNCFHALRRVHGWRVIHAVALAQGGAVWLGIRTARSSPDGSQYRYRIVTYRRSPRLAKGENTHECPRRPALASGPSTALVLGGDHVRRGPSMSTTTTRSASAALLALPLLLGLSVPATAAPPQKDKMSGSSVAGWGTAYGELSGLPGNVHFVAVGAEESNGGEMVSGQLMSWSCEDGAANPWMEEGVCGEPVGFYDLQATDVALTIGKRMSSATVAGSFTAVDFYDGCPEEWCEATPVGSVDLRMEFTAVSKVSTQRTKEFFRDPETGYSYRYSGTHRLREAAVTGTLEAIRLVDTQGTLGTFKVLNMVKE